MPVTIVSVSVSGRSSESSFGSSSCDATGGVLNGGAESVVEAEVY